MRQTKTYPGIHNDKHAGMTSVGTIIRDAWVFGLIPEEETCAGWTFDQVEQLYDKVSRAWEPFGHLVSRLPPELRERHSRIYEAAVRQAREMGWNPELDEDDD
jgi:hypothetical protein